MRSSQHRSAVTSLLLNTLVLGVFWLAGFATFRILGNTMAGTWVVVTVTAIAWVVAATQRLRLAAFLVGIFLAFNLAEAVIHAIFGIRAAQGAGTHFAVLIAATLAIVIGTVLGYTIGPLRTITSHASAARGDGAATAVGI